MALEPPLDPFSMQLEQARNAFVFISYAHQDKKFRDRLEDHLSNLKYRGLITTWHDLEIRAGEEWAQQIDIYLNKSQIILLLISSDFMASEYYYGIEMKRALERHEQREADVIPILLRPVLYTDAPFAKLHMLPTSGKPVTRWRDRDSAFLDIAYGIERVAQKYYLPSTATKRDPNLDSILRNADRPHRSLDEELGKYYIRSDARPRGPRSPQRRQRLGGFYLVAFTIALIAAGIFALSQHPNLIPLVIIGGFLLLLAGILAYSEVAKRNERKRYYEDAIAAYQQALLHNPSDGYAHRGVGNAFYALKRYNEALNAFLQAIQYAPTPAAYAGLGNVYAKLRRYNEAVAAYEKAIELDPTMSFTHDGLIPSLLALGRTQEAKQHSYENNK